MSEASELSIIKGLLSELGISPQKALGQNFLINQSIIEKIINHFEISNKKVIEIGPGLGALTRQIEKKTKNITLIELDKKIISFWRQKNIKVIDQDALQVCWQGFEKEQNILISNLPYQISASLVIELSIQSHPLLQMVLMFQKEVAQRIQSAPNKKSYGIISVMAQNTWNIKKLADLSVRDFYPSPKVESRVLAFEKKPANPWVNKKFLSFVKHCFQNRRKLLINKVIAYGKSKGLSKEQVVLVIESLSIDPKVRAENLSPELFLSLYKSIFEISVY